MQNLVSIILLYSVRLILSHLGKNIAMPDTNPGLLAR